LIVVRPMHWRLADGPRFQASLAVNNKDSVLRQVVKVDRPLLSYLRVRHAGTYDVWVRIGQPANTSSPLTVELFKDGKTVLSGEINHDAGAAGRGGPTGFRTYREKAAMVVPGGAATTFDLTNKNDTGSVKNSIIDDMAGDDGKSQALWVNSFRIEKVDAKSPFLWWKLSGVALTPGDYELKVKPAGGDSKTPPLLDAAILTTNRQVVYPFGGDIDAPQANYVRFRIDDLGKDKKLFIKLGFLIHRLPFGASASANPEGFPKDLKAQPHIRTGFTRWYRMSDIEDVPSGNFTLSVGIEGDARGLSQFATFPQDDAVLHQFDWNELDGRYLAIGSAATGQVTTGRDQTRMHYEYALNAGGGRIYPMMRGDTLTLGNSWGLASGGASEYMMKTLRLLGLNYVSASDGVKNEERYGWIGRGGVKPFTVMPYDEEQARQRLDEAFKPYQTREFTDRAIRTQLADEPIEMNTSAYTAPFWRFEGGAAGVKKPVTERAIPENDGKVVLTANGEDVEERKAATNADPEAEEMEDSAEDAPVQSREQFRDVTGSSDLNTRRVDLQDCVFEGEVSGGWVGFRAGLDDPRNPKRWVYWRVGKLSANGPPNSLSYGVPGDKFPKSFVKKAARLNRGKATPFKIVFERGKAALFINNTIMHMFEGLPDKGGFGIYGPPKSVYSLRIRPIATEEHIVETASQFFNDKLDGVGVDDGIELDARDFEERPTKGTKVDFKKFIDTEMVQAGGIPAAQVGFRKWCAAKGITPDQFGKGSWDDVRMLTVRTLMEDTPADRRRYYWSRRYSSWLTPRMYGLAAEAMLKNVPNKNTKFFVALSGHSLYMHQQWLPMDIMELAAQGPGLMAGVSDWMSYGWRWDSWQSVAYSVAPMNAGARRYGKEWGQEPISYPMMHQVGPNVFRAYTMLANQVKHISFWAYGPTYAATEGTWSDNPGNHRDASFISNRIAQVDDILPKARMRPSRVAMLYSLSNEYWDPTSSYADKRSAFLNLSHEYFQPEVVTEEQIEKGALQHYDALYVLDTAVTTAAQEKIAQWTQNGGTLWACASAATLNEYGEPHDLLTRLAGLERAFSDTPRTYKPKPEFAAQFGRQQPDDYLTPAAGESGLRPHSVFRRGKLSAVKWEGARVRANYDDGVTAFGEKTVGKGKVVYLGHRAGATCSATSINLRSYHTIWSDTPRAVLTLPLHEAKVEREVILSEPTIMTQPMSRPDGTVLMLYNMKPNDATNLRIGLKEPAKPASVQAFGRRAMELKDVPFEYKDGRVWITLPVLEGHGVGDIVRVRRTTPPADPRDAEMRARTEQQLKSTEARTLSAGLWFAGLNPQWNLGDGFEKFLTHEAWEVRLAAAEALWRLNRKAAAEQILAALQKEQDPHVLSEQLYALATLGHAQAPALSLKYLTHEREYVRRQAMRAVLAQVEVGKGVTPSAAQRTLAASAAKLAHECDLPNDAWGTSSSWKEKLLMLMPAKEILDEAVTVYATPAARDPKSPWGGDLDLYAAFIARNEEAFADYLARGLPGGQELLLEVASRRQAPQLVKAMVEIIDTVKPANAGNFNQALRVQRDKGLTRLAFERRAILPRAVADGLPVVLEMTYGVNLGVVLTDWDLWLKQNPA